MRMRFHTFLASLLLSACAMLPSTTQAVTCFVVRHADKVDASRNPDLNADGLARAQALVDGLARQDLSAICITDFTRTTQTVLPTAYPVLHPAAEFTARLRAAHPQGSILIAGQSNTVPAIVAALCGCSVTPMPDDEYDRLSIIHIDANGRKSLLVERHGAPTPRP